MNLLTGGSCPEHIDDSRQDEAYFNAVGAERIPDPTTACDWCRRFDTANVLHLINAFNRVLARIWQQQPNESVGYAIIEGDRAQVFVDGNARCNRENSIA